jgi:flagellar L-ring protein precursor FlgH
MIRTICYLLSVIALLALPAAARKKAPVKTVSPLEQYIQDASQRGRAASAATTPGSLWRSGASLADLARDPRASQVDDLITVEVSDKASAVTKGGTTSSRKSSAKSSVASIFGPTRVGGALSNLANLSGDTQLQGQGETSRESVLTTTLSARITHVLPNGYLALEGVKDVMVNSERQVVTVRGVIRPMDLSPGNAVTSDRVAQLEVRVNGKGVVGDAVRRPFILYRILMGLLPF